MFMRFIIVMFFVVGEGRRYLKAKPEPDRNPTTAPTIVPLPLPTKNPSFKPTTKPTTLPTTKPTTKPSTLPTLKPTLFPTFQPTSYPSYHPTLRPSFEPTYKSTHLPTKPEPKPKPAPLPTMMPLSLNLPTMQPTTSIINQTLLNELSDLIDNPETVSQINTLLTDEVQRMSSILYASVVSETIKITPPTVSCETGSIYSNTRNCTIYKEKLRQISDKMSRGIECAYYVANGNYTLTRDILTVSLVSYLKTNEDYLQYLNMTETVRTNIDNSIELVLGQNYSSSPSYAASCDILGTLLLNHTTSLFSDYNETRRSRRSRRQLTTDLNEDEDVCSSDPAVYIVYVNGMNCDEKAQFAGLHVLTDLIQSSSIPNLVRTHFTQLTNPRVVVTSVSNPTQGVIEDLAEVLHSKFHEDLDRINSFIVAAFMSLKQKFTNLFTEHVTQTSWNEFITEYYENLAIKARSNPNKDLVVGRILSKVKYLIQHGHAVVLVPHSQGNLYTNEAYKLLTTTEKQYVRISSVANPSAFVGYSPNRDYYGTRQDDKIISLVPTALTYTISTYSRHYECITDILAIFTVGLQFETCINHGFIPAYLNDQYVWYNSILPNIISAVSNVNFPSTLLQTGFITITLTWSAANPDVDLHVYEPDGTHVYYSNKVGLKGELDYDDVNGEGPENYYVFGCGTSIAGTYTVGVNYYYGSTPETAKIAIRVGTQTHYFTKYLPSARGHAGDPYPLLVAKIIYDPEDDLFPIQVIPM